MADQYGSAVKQAGDAVQTTGAEFLQLALVLAAVGTLAMALVELIKSLTKARQIYNRWAVLQWTRSKPRTLRTLVCSLFSHQDNVILAELELLALGGHEDPGPLYDQPVEKMMGQIQAAVNVAFEFPDAYPNLYAFITKVPSIFWVRKADGLAKEDYLKWELGAHQVHKVQRQAEPLSNEDASAAAEATQARSRLSNLIARKLDAFQNEIQYFWERLNQWVAGPIGALIFYMSYASLTDRTLTRPAEIALSIMAGILAPFAKQMSSSLSSFGK